MKLTINKDQLITGLSRVMPCMGKHGGVLLNADKALTISTDQSLMSMQTSALAKIETAGRVGLSGKTLLQIAETTNEESITIEHKKGSVAITCGRSKFSIPSIPESDFPPVREKPKANVLNTDACIIAGMLDATSYAIATNHSILGLNGLLFRVRDKKLFIVGCDGKILAETKKTIDSTCNAEVVLMRECVSILSRMLKHGLCCEVVFDGASFCACVHYADGESASMCSGLYAAQYPDYTRAFPRGDLKPVKVNRTELIEAIRRASVVSDKLTNYLRMHIKDGMLSLHGSSVALGISEETVAAEYSGPAIIVGIRADQMNSVLGACQGTNVTLGFADDEKKAFRITGEDDSFSAYAIPVKTL